MSDGTRPGGLTALAVLNFIGGSLLVLISAGTMATPFLLEFAEKAAEAERSERAEAAGAGTEGEGDPDAAADEPATEPAAESTESTESTEPSAESTEPSAESTEPSAESTEPSAEPTEPGLETTDDGPPKTTDDGLTDEQREQLRALREMGKGTYYLIAALGAIRAILLLVSGVGYLKMKRVLGWLLGNLYVACSIVFLIFQVLTTPEELGGGNFNIGAIAALIYPLITLFLINFTFKEDLQR